MSSQVVRVEQYSKGSLNNLGNEAERGKVKHRNEDIRIEDEHLNHYYKKTEYGFYNEWNQIKTSLNAIGRVNKKTIAFEGMVVTSDQEFFKSLGWEQGKPAPKAVEDYFKKSYEFAKKEIGFQGTDKNIMSAAVHYDEKTPHLQLYYLPITEKYRDKVYAKDETGKILRTSKGSAIQARDANNKIAYKEHENPSEPKLSRSEFWRVRGGKFSYRQMQDRYHETIGKEYNLERGEVGSDAKHRTKNQWEADQLKKENNKLVDEIAPLRDMKNGMDAVEPKGKIVLPGYIAVKKSDLAKTIKTAKAFEANRDRFLMLADRDIALDQRTKALDARENMLILKERTVEDALNQNGRKAVDLMDKEFDLDAKYKEKYLNLDEEYTIKFTELNHKIDNQKNLNRLYDEAVDTIYEHERTIFDLEKAQEIQMEESADKIDELTLENQWLASANRAVKSDMLMLMKDYDDKLEKSKEKLKTAYTRFKIVVSSVNMLKYDRTEGYGLDLRRNPKADGLLQGIRKYAMAVADFTEQEVLKDVGTNRGISDAIKQFEPKISREMEIE